MSEERNDSINQSLRSDTDMALQIWSREGEQVITLTDVSDTTTQEQLRDLIDSCELFNENDLEVIGDLPFEGVVVSSENDPFPADDLDGVEYVDMTFMDYVHELRQWLDSM